MAKKIISARGSVLLTTLFFITLLAVVAWGVYDLAMGTYRLSQRNEYRARAKALADSELDYVYFRIKTTMTQGTPASGVPSALGDICDIPSNPSTPGQTCTPSNLTRLPFGVAFQTTPEGWTVGRSISYDFSASGTKDHKTSSYSYFTVKVQVQSTTSPVGPVVLRVGRRMNNAVNSIFQYNIFAQGDLEFAPGGNVVINGDIAANGGIYMGSQDNLQSLLSVGAYVRYLQGQAFNTTQLANGTTIKAPVFTSTLGQAGQVQTMGEPENLLGGLSAKDIASKYGINHTYDAGGFAVSNPDYNALFGTITVSSTNTPDANQLAEAENRVYRAVITPPPSAIIAANYQAEYPDVSSAPTLAGLSDDPGVAALRAYNRAGLILTVNADGTAAILKQNSDGSTTNVTSDLSSAISSTTMYDLREAANVAITEIDVSILKTKLASGTYADFNGLLYVYLGNLSTSQLAAVRLKNGDATPVSAGDHGFSVATNGGLYVKGNYNTTTTDGNPRAADGSNINPAMLMADAVTVLSSNWSDPVVTAQTGDSTAVITAKHDPLQTIASRVAATGTTTVGAGILTGNITEDSSGGYIYSGGGHNLVRFLENWGASSVDFYGSIGRLFESTHFVHPFIKPTNPDGSATGIYQVPAMRSYTFNESLKKKSPYGAPSATIYDRGTIFSW